MAIDYGDIFNRYAQARLDQATQPFNDPEAYFNNRLQNQFGVNLDEQGNVKPRSTTITNNDDGSQTVTTKHEVTPIAQPQPVNYGFTQPQVSTGLGLQMPQAYAQPMAPVTQPVAPMAAQPMAQPQPIPEPPPMAVPQSQPILVVTSQPMAQPAQPMAQPAQPMAAQPQPIPEPPPMAAPMAQPAPMAQLPQPGPGVQLAGPMVPGAIPNAVPQAPVPGIGMTMQSPGVQPEEQHWSQRIAELGSSAPKLAAYYGNENNPEGGRKVAADLYATELDKTRKTQDATKIIDAAISGDARAVTQLSRDLASKKEEGSYVKAILLARLGLTDLAKEEQQKLGGSTNIMGMMGRNGENYTVEMASDGSIRRAWDDKGDRVNDQTKAGLQAYALNPKNVTTHTGKVQDKDTGEIYYEQTTPQGIRLVAPNGKQYVGPSENLRAYGIGSDIETKNALQLNELQNKLAYAPLSKRLEIIAESEAKYGKLDPRVKADILGQSTNVPTPGTVAGTVGQPTTGPGVRPAAIAPQTAQVAPQMAEPQMAAQAPGAAIRPVSPTAPMAAPQTAAPQMAAPGVGGVAGGTPAQREANLAIQKSAAEAEIQRKKELAVAEQKPPAEARGKNVAKDVNNQNFANETYDLIRPVAELVKKSTGSGIGASVDSLAAKIGASTEGAQAIAQLEPLVYPILANVPRFEGSQSEYDVKTYQRAAGDFANPEKPVKTRLAALQGMITLLKKYDKEGKNDWTFSGGNPASPSTSGIKIISREKVQ